MDADVPRAGGGFVSASMNVGVRAGAAARVAAHARGRTGHVNVSEHLGALARTVPYQRALVVPGPRDRTGRRAYFHQTFLELDRSVDRYARGLTALGVKQGMRVLMLVTPSIELFGLTFALIRLGAVPVMLDPGMGRERVLGAIREVEPEAMIAVPRGHLARALFPRSFASVRIRVMVGRTRIFGATTLEELEALGATGEVRAPDTRADETAAILFTSGSTGAPKGVLYTHGIFEEQVRVFREDLGIGVGEVDLSAFPLFSLFSLALGVTIVVPDMDTTRPGAVIAERIAESIVDLGVTYAFGSPAFWSRIAEYAEAKGLVFSSMRRVLMAGAPAPVPLLERLVRIVPTAAEVYTPYGATESLPISLPTARTLLAGPARRTEEGHGTCVGVPLARTEVRIIAITDGSIATLEDAKRLGPNQIGEIIVRSPMTTRGYFRRPHDDARSKIFEKDSFWHRMGDVGYLDEEGRLWFCGRKSQRVETTEGVLFTECCEAIIHRHPKIARSALVGLGARGRERPVIVVELKRGLVPTGESAATLTREILELAAGFSVTRPIRDVLFHPSLPVDPRHNAKIIREALAVWAAKLSS